MLVAHRLARLSALETHYADVSARLQSERPANPQGLTRFAVAAHGPISGVSPLPPRLRLR
jgi:hypothetical protein